MEVSINPGELRSRVQIQSESSTPDDFGQPQQTWSTILETRARIRALLTREKFQANQLSSWLTHEIAIRWPSSVTIAPGMRVTCGDHIYMIQGCNNVQQRNVLLLLECVAINETS
jgi:SPP1 family predicted phage head-tail adaptor